MSIKELKLKVCRAWPTREAPPAPLPGRRRLPARPPRDPTAANPTDASSLLALLLLLYCPAVQPPRMLQPLLIQPPQRTSMEDLQASGSKRNRRTAGTSVGQPHVGAIDEISREQIPAAQAS